MASLRTKRTVTAGFIPLVDCAVLAVAGEMDFAAEEGIDLRLSKEVSWANIRDKINLGHLDCAHMLAGMPIASGLGVGHVTVEMTAPWVLGANGNAITVSAPLFDTLTAVDPSLDFLDPAATGAALARDIARRRAQGAPPLTFGMVFPVSNHNYLLRYWMGSAGIDPDREVRLVVIPPPLMVESLEAGQIDGFCVGEPWNSLAVERGSGCLLNPTSAIWKRATEKVLGLRKDWAEHNRDLVDALLRGLQAAAVWAADPVHHRELASLLSQPAYLNVPAEIVLRSLEGNLVVAPGTPPCSVPDFLMLRTECDNRPQRAHGRWLFGQMVRWGQVDDSTEGRTLAEATFADGVEGRVELFDGGS